MNEYPNVLEMEKTLLSAMLQYGDNAILPVMNILTAEDFYRPQHRLIYKAILAVYDRKENPDVLLVEAELKSRGELERVELTYLWSLIEKAYSATRAVSYAEKIKEESTRRRVIALGKELITEAGDEMKSVEELVKKVDEITLTLTSSTCKEPWTNGKELIAQGFKDILERTKNQGLKGVRTGLRDLDLITGGLKKSDLIILAARPAMGKTALAMNIAIAATREVPVLIFSLEMSKAQLTDRILSAVANVNLTRIIEGTLTQREKNAIASAVELLEDRPWSIDDTGDLNISELKMRARQFKHQKGLGLIVVDYLQLVSSARAYRDRVQEVSEVSRGLKALAKELNVAVLALSQLSRGVEQRAEKKPQLSDLRDSGAIEQDADIVMFLYRASYYDQDDAEDKNIAELILAKNRNGATGATAFRFDAECVSFKDLTRRAN